MAGVNKAILLGNLGAAPEIRRTQAGAPVASFSLAINKTWKDKTTGERREAAEWLNVVIFNEQLCTVAEKFLRKGSRVYLEGEIRTRKWQDKAGNDRWTTEIVLPQFGAQLVLLDAAEKPPQTDERSYGQRRDEAPSTTPTTTREALDDEIPF